jgi:hypothetical protein
MALEFRSSARRKRWRGIDVFQTVIFTCVLLYPFQWDSVSGQTQTKLKTIERFRFQVTDSENDIPIPGAAVSLVYWQKRATTEVKMEIERYTDTNGLAEFPSVEADKMAVSVTVKAIDLAGAGSTPTSW